MCLVAACTHSCHATPSGPACSCPTHLHLQRDGVTCAPNHVCADWGVCSQVSYETLSKYIIIEVIVMYCLCVTDMSTAEEPLQVHVRRRVPARRRRVHMQEHM